MGLLWLSDPTLLLGKVCEFVDAPAPGPRGAGLSVVVRRGGLVSARTPLGSTPPRPPSSTSESSNVIYYVQAPQVRSGSASAELKERLLVRKYSRQKPYDGLEHSADTSLADRE